MKNDYIKQYNKAMNFYNNGQMNRALEICENILANDLSCSEVLNLKGLMLYQKGLLKEAKIVWKLNCDINTDSVAKKYIEDCKSDDERTEKYKDAEYNLKNMNIDKAMMLFRECMESEFNSIKVNTGIAMCYMRKGDNYRAKEFIDKALHIDNEAVTANALKKDLINLGLYSNENRVSKKVLSVITVLFIIGAICVGGYSIYTKVSLNNSISKDSSLNTEEDIKKDESLGSDSNKDTNDSDQEDQNLENEQADKKEAIFNNENVALLLKNKDVDKLYDEINMVNKETLSGQDLELYNNAIELLTTNGVSKFYEYGVWYFNNGNYNSAKVELEKAYKYCDKSDLKEHIVFYKGSTASQLGDNSEALKLYKEYYSLYPKGAYIEGVLYELALLTNTTNKNMGKEYARELVNNYPNSLYINDYIRDIVK
ncbi:tetratricopeptide repeat protein [Clostridium butyricum]|uniref:tetratricopeptide repeat protein n=1 Tax=Clostridium butyricum TaxID=1492 RepID=UPI0003D5DFD4|nr:MAG: TPR-repeat-containing protein [Clostridium butyricum DORA_1]MDU1507449.1 tetratricopeptide repeat protein [Clostridium butyricum]MDU4800534.1 tetratricopeptide repeat protein [Clostridium butyricum]